MTEETKEEQKETTEATPPAEEAQEVKEEVKETAEAAPPAEEAPEVKEEAQEAAEAALPAEEAPEVKETAEAAPPPEKAAAAEEKVIVYKKEKPTNCEECNKALSKKSWYYRNGNYYCNKKCWKAFSMKAQEEAEGAGG